MTIRSKIIVLATGCVAATSLVFLGAILKERRDLGREFGEQILSRSYEDTERAAQSALLMCQQAEAQNEQRLLHSLELMREEIAKAGAPGFAAQNVEWQAVNQFDQSAQKISLPRMSLGKVYLGENYDAAVPAPVVDDIRRSTLDAATIFQRMNEDGDMLRVCTSVLTTSGKRAVGTYIPHRNPDGSANPVIEAILSGKSFRGRAFVVNEWHTAVYEPLFDEKKERVIGMTYVGVSLTACTQELRTSLQKLVVGKTGYVYVVGTKGDERGRYILSYKGQRDGEMIWGAKDAAGKLFIQEAIQKALSAKPGETAYDTYSWQNSGESVAREKLVALKYFAPWDWVIGAGAYRDDFNDSIRVANATIDRMTRWMLLLSGIVIAAVVVASVFFARGISRPIVKLMEELSHSADQVTAASLQTSKSGESLAAGATEQAASLEETSASLEEMASMATQNSNNAENVKQLANAARQAGDSGAARVTQLNEAMEAIRSANGEVAKIVKAIDEIAFQTNLLALNAAVEAARAGSAGLGFAVVADEVRTLAQRSAVAAKESSERIQDALTKTHQGVELSGSVAKELQQIVEKIRQVDAIAVELATASKEQTSGLSQVTTAVAQMDQVTQSNAAHAEESASAAVELNAQAVALREIVGELSRVVGRVKAKVEDGADAGTVESEAAQPIEHQAAPVETVHVSNPAKTTRRVGAVRQTPRLNGKIVQPTSAKRG
ncbi:methyl-accepting chemotaxis protein [Opitutaceae bacterium EW11]|nr:methyl-accepting chemotaxis protein [Opitutaceae bacterium EW11]